MLKKKKISTSSKDLILLWLDTHGFRYILHILSHIEFDIFGRCRNPAPPPMSPMTFFWTWVVTKRPSDGGIMY